MIAKNIGKNVIITPIKISISVPAKDFAKQKIANFVVKTESATVPISEASG